MAKKKVQLKFSNHLINKPIVYKLVKDFDLTFNILKASIKPDEEGEMVLEIDGQKKNYNKAMAFLNDIDDYEHLALVKGEIDPEKEILVRVHSQCLTGDVFGSYRCDCGPQLERAMAIVQKEGISRAAEL